MSQRVTLLAAFFLGASLALASGGVYKDTKHGDPVNGVARLQGEARGSCAQCHDLHGSRQGQSNGGPYPYALFAPSTNALCATCHQNPSTLGVYEGAVTYAVSSHATSTYAVWPGTNPPARPTGDAGKCVNCHTPHGARDTSGPVPSMAVAREESLCLACHQGTPASDIRSQFAKTFTHPVTTSGKHDVAEGGDPSRYSVSSGNRHAECSDCHNAHEAKADLAPPDAPGASNRLAGVSRVRVTNGAAGTKPIYTYAGPSEPAFANEYELCFKCHSSFTTQPAGQSDLALKLNPANASYHPVEAAGKNAIDAASFVNGWSSSKLTYCSDCHASDSAGSKGPHGSTYKGILKKAYAASSLPQVSAATDLCFDCHSYDTYGNPSAPAVASAASRFNPPSTGYGHAYHVGSQGQTCYACHETHGSPMNAALVATGRAPGLTSYFQSPSGGTCSATCHQSPGPRTYAANYAR